MAKINQKEKIQKAKSKAFKERLIPYSIHWNSSWKEFIPLQKFRSNCEKYMATRFIKPEPKYVPRDPVLPRAKANMTHHFEPRQKPTFKCYQGTFQLKTLNGKESAQQVKENLRCPESARE